MAVQIDVGQIPPTDVQNICQTFLAAVKSFYENPEHIKQFEDWKKRRETSNCVDSKNKSYKEEELC